MVESFGKTCCVEVHEVFSESDDARDRLLLQTRGNRLRPDPHQWCQLCQLPLSWLAGLDLSLIPQVANIDKRWLDAFDGISGYGIPCFWGTLGIAMARALRMRVVAEGKVMECDEIQDYLFSCPLPPVEFGDLLNEGRIAVAPLHLQSVSA